jgi:hypothetical protein
MAEENIPTQNNIPVYNQEIHSVEGQQNKQNLTCPVCHQPVLEEWYFCPNCGTKLKEPPLSITIGSQLSLYTISIITPIFMFLTVGSWKGWKYFKSSDPRAKKIGIISIIIMVLSTIILIWLTVYFTEQSMKGINSLTSGILSGSGNLNGL